MHRRQFISMIAGAAAGAAAGTTALRSTGAAAMQDATPRATPEHHGRPRPIVLGDGIEMVDYRIYPSQDVRRIIGEIMSTRDDIVDAPVVSITFPDLEGTNGFAYASCVLPVIERGGSNMIFGVLPNEIDSDEKLASASLGLCNPVGPGKYTKGQTGVNLRLSDLIVDHRPTAERFQATVHNDGPSVASYVVIRGLVRDSADRLVGCTTTINIGRLAAGASKNFAFWLASTVENLANPFRMLEESDEYATQLLPGLIGPITVPGCFPESSSN